MHTHTIQTGVTRSKAWQCLIPPTQSPDRCDYQQSITMPVSYLKYLVQTGVTMTKAWQCLLPQNTQSRQVWLWLSKASQCLLLQTHSPDRCDWAKHHNASHLKPTVQTGVTEQSITMPVTSNTQSRQVWLSKASQCLLLQTHSPDRCDYQQCLTMCVS